MGQDMRFFVAEESERLAKRDRSLLFQIGIAKACVDSGEWSEVQFFQRVSALLTGGKDGA